MYRDRMKLSETLSQPRTAVQVAEDERGETMDRQTVGKGCWQGRQICPMPKWGRTEARALTGQYFPSVSYPGPVD